MADGAGFFFVFLQFPPKKRFDRQPVRVKIVAVFSAPQGGRQAPRFLGIGCRPSAFVSSWRLCLVKSCMVGECVATAAVFFLTCGYYLRVRPQDLTGAAKRLVEAVTFCAEDELIVTVVFGL